MAQSVVEIGITESLGSRRHGWIVDASLSPVEGWVITLTHPASAGLVITTGTADASEAISFGESILAASTEIDIAAAAPHLQHAQLVAGLRTVATMFGWESAEVRAVAFLMFENGHLTLDETSWLSGYEGVGAPMQPRSPRG